jgi:general secretion pathway protein I
MLPLRRDQTTVRPSGRDGARPGGCDTGGFTLLEVMIAMAILAIALVAVFSSQAQSISMVGNSRFTTTAALLAQGKMVEYEMKAPGELGSASGDFGKDFPDYEWRADVREEAPLLHSIEITVTNTRMERNNTYRLVLYRALYRATDG